MAVNGRVLPLLFLSHGFLQLDSVEHEELKGCSIPNNLVIGTVLNIGLFIVKTLEQLGTVDQIRLRFEHLTDDLAGPLLENLLRV